MSRSKKVDISNVLPRGYGIVLYFDPYLEEEMYRMWGHICGFHRVDFTYRPCIILNWIPFENFNFNISKFDNMARILFLTYSSLPLPVTFTSFNISIPDDPEKRSSLFLEVTLSPTLLDMYDRLHKALKNEGIMVDDDDDQDPNCYLSKEWFCKCFLPQSLNETVFIDFLREKDVSMRGAVIQIGVVNKLHYPDCLEYIWSRTPYLTRMNEEGHFQFSCIEVAAYFDEELKNRINVVIQIFSNRHINCILDFTEPRIILLSGFQEDTGFASFVQRFLRKTNGFIEFDITLSVLGSNQLESSLALAPIPTFVLLQSHKDLYDAMAANANWHIYRQFKPDHWVPECILAKGIPVGQVEEAVGIALEHFREGSISGRITRVGLAAKAYDPYGTEY